MSKFNVHNRFSAHKAGTGGVSDFSEIDLDQAEHIEISDSGVPGAEDDAHLRYFCTPREFKTRLDALVRLARKANISVIYGVITLREEVTGSDNRNLMNEEELTLVAIEETIVKFEERFVKSIRVARKYQPPIAQSDKMRSTDHEGYNKIQGNFDLICRTPGEVDKEHTIEFVLFDCPMENALRKKKVLTDFARNVGLKIRFEMSRYAG